MAISDDQSDAADHWRSSADAYIAVQDAGDPSRTVLLDPVMLRLSGDVSGTRVLDLGCGEGRFCRMLSKRGARTVGIDATPRMAETAAARDSGGRYALASADSLPFADASFGLVVSYVTLVDIARYREAIAECARVLVPGGRMLVANLSFASASPVGREWALDANGTKLHRRIDHYLSEHRQVFAWSGIRIVNWHRPLQNYMQAYLGVDLMLREFLEPVPEDESLRDDPWWEDTFRVPNFTVMLWEKA